jgi:hypothetical protein
VVEPHPWPRSVANRTDDLKKWFRFVGRANCAMLPLKRGQFRVTPFALLMTKCIHLSTTIRCLRRHIHQSINPSIHPACRKNLAANA